MLARTKKKPGILVKNLISSKLFFNSMRKRKTDQTVKGNLIAKKLLRVPP